VHCIEFAGLASAIAEGMLQCVHSFEQCESASSPIRRETPSRPKPIEVQGVEKFLHNGTAR
jgi:hypothetical protein